MKGRTQFTKEEAHTIRSLLDRKNQYPGKEWQKPIRDQIRSIGFYISDFGASSFTSGDFDKLIQYGRIKIVD